MFESRGYALIIIAVILLAITVPPLVLYGTGHIKMDENRQDKLFIQIGFIGTAILSLFLVFMGIKIQMNIKPDQEKTRLITYEDTRRAPLPPPIAVDNQEDPIIYSQLPSDPNKPKTVTQPLRGRLNTDIYSPWRE